MYKIRLACEHYHARPPTPRGAAPALPICSSDGSKNLSIRTSDSRDERSEIRAAGGCLCLQCVRPLLLFRLDHQEQPTRRVLIPAPPRPGDRTCKKNKRALSAARLRPSVHDHTHLDPVRVRLRLVARIVGPAARRQRAARRLRAHVRPDPRPCAIHNGGDERLPRPARVGHSHHRNCSVPTLHRGRRIWFKTEAPRDPSQIWPQHMPPPRLRLRYGLFPGQIRVEPTPTRVRQSGIAANSSPSSSEHGGKFAADGAGGPARIKVAPAPVHVAHHAAHPTRGVRSAAVGMRRLARDQPARAGATPPPAAQTHGSVDCVEVPHSGLGVRLGGAIRPHRPHAAEHADTADA
eukprot:scaffold4961_cov114-Isochrysis_galbana.AAC.4